MHGLPAIVLMVMLTWHVYFRQLCYDTAPIMTL